MRAPESARNKDTRTEEQWNVLAEVVPQNFLRIMHAEAEYVERTLNSGKLFVPPRLAAEGDPWTRFWSLANKASRSREEEQELIYHWGIIRLIVENEWDQLVVMAPSGDEGIRWMASYFAIQWHNRMAFNSPPRRQKEPVCESFRIWFFNHHQAVLRWDNEPEFQGLDVL
jgi:hypothetical protein